MSVDSFQPVNTNGRVTRVVCANAELFVSLIGIGWETWKWSALGARALYFHMRRTNCSLPPSLPPLFQQRSLRAIIIMQLIEYLIFYLIIYTFTRTVSIDSKGKIRDRGRDENREIVRFKKSLTIFWLNSHNFRTCSLQFYYSRRDWFSTYVILKIKVILNCERINDLYVSCSIHLKNKN